MGLLYRISRLVTLMMSTMRTTHCLVLMVEKLEEMDHVRHDRPYLHPVYGSHLLAGNGQLQPHRWGWVMEIMKQEEDDWDMSYLSIAAFSSFIIIIHYYRLLLSSFFFSCIYKRYSYHKLHYYLSFKSYLFFFNPLLFIAIPDHHFSHFYYLILSGRSRVCKYFLLMIPCSLHPQI